MSALTLNQLETIYDQVDILIDNLDPAAIDELFGGDEKDIEKVLGTLFEETKNILIYENGKFTSSTFGYLDRFTESVEETLRCFSFNYFTQSCLPEFQMNWHHVEWGNLLQIYNRLCIIAARDHSKSFTFSLAYPIWKMYRYSKNIISSNYASKIISDRSHSKLGMIITNEYGLAKHLLGIVKEEIEQNDILKESLFPGKNAGKWAETEITCKNGASLVVKSYGSKMRGFHPGWIVCDDLLNDSVLYSEEQRNKYINFFHSVIMNMIVPGGQVCVVGTPYSTKDLYADLKTKRSWKVFEYPAIMPDGTLLWGDRHNIESIIEKKESQGSTIFSREILVRPISSESTIFPWAMLEKSFVGMDEFTLQKNIWSVPRKFKRVVTGCDFAMSANVGADYTVFITLGVDDLGNYWLLNMFRGKGLSYNEQIAQMKKIKQDFNPEIIMVETNQAQVLFAQMGRDANLPIVEHNTGTNKYNLQDGLPGVAVLFEQNRIRFPRGDAYSRDITDIICMELSSITWTEKGKLEGVGSNDDCPMALWIALRAATYVNSSFNFGFI